jgi:CRP-like cAMP-binding protein
MNAAAAPIPQRLREVGLFADLDDPALAELTGIAHVEDHPAGTTLFREGGRNANLGFVVDGHVALEMHVPRGGATRILTIGPGQLLAWSALLGDGTMTATAIVQENVRMVVFPADKLRQLCESNHDIGYRVMKQMAISVSRRLLATRLQLLDLFAETDPVAHARGTANL